MKIRSKVKAGGISLNHKQPVKGLRVRSSVKAGLAANHSQAVRGLWVRSNVKAGRLSANHN